MFIILSYLSSELLRDRHNNITAAPLHAIMTARATRPTYTLPRSPGCPRTDLPPTALQAWLAERGARRRGERAQKAGATGGG
eukprot:scaffold16705_cov80-Phaeocystis_antarctica.AAC.2